MKKKQLRRSNCPINFALQTFGDQWSLLIMRDIIYFGKQTYGEFLASEEKIATNILASRLEHLEQQGMLSKKPHASDKRKEMYVLTEKGLDVIPILLEMAEWSARHDPQSGAPPDWIALVQANKAEMIQLIRETIRQGSCVFVGEKSVLSQLMSGQANLSASPAS